MLLPFCDSDSNTQLFVKKGVHLSIANRTWTTVKHCDSLPAGTIASYVTLLLQW